MARVLLPYLLAVRGWCTTAASGALPMLAVLCVSVPAAAQSWVTDAQLSLATGLEGASGGGGVGWQRARTRLILGLDLGNDEHGVDAYGLRTFVELERSLSVGAEVGYLRWVLPELSLFFGGAAVLAPSTLFGVTAAVNYTFPLGERLGLSVLGSFSALPLGSDRPDDGVVVWALLGLGIRGRL